MLRYLRVAAPFLVLLVLAACSADKPGDATSNNDSSSITGPSFDDKDKKGDLCGRVWMDTDCNGIQNDGESGIKNVAVYLLDCQGMPLDTTMTDSEGNYCFVQIAAGDYKVMVDLPDGYEFAPQNAGSDDMVDSDVDMNGMSDCTTVEDAKTTNIDAGLCELAKKGELCGRVWIDYDCDGIQDDMEKGIKGVTVDLLDCDGTVIATTTTDDGGNYCFTQLPAGDYKVRVDLPDGYYFSPRDQGGDDMIDSDVDMDGMSDCVAVEDAKTTDVDAGLCEREKKGDDGCTPGYWKTKPYDAVWGPTGYNWDESFNDVFGCDIFDDSVTLLEAMWQGGGGIYKLGRHGVAALLNAAHPDVDYAYSVDEVKDMVCNDGNANALAAANEAGCPIDAHGRVKDGDDDDKGDDDDDDKGDDNGGKKGDMSVTREMDTDETRD